MTARPQPENPPVSRVAILAPTSHRAAARDRPRRTAQSAGGLSQPGWVLAFAQCEDNPDSNFVSFIGAMNFDADGNCCCPEFSIERAKRKAVTMRQLEVSRIVHRQGNFSANRKVADQA
jgi:hypothetical protein